MPLLHFLLGIFCILNHGVFATPLPEGGKNSSSAVASALPRPRSTQLKDLIDFDGKPFLYFRLLENGEAPRRTMLDGLLDRIHAAAVNRAVYQSETRASVRQHLSVDGPILVVLEGIVLVPSPNEVGKVDIYLETLPYETFIARVAIQNLVESNEPIRLKIPTVGGGNQMGAGRMWGELHLKWNKKKSCPKISYARIDVKVSVTGLGERPDSIEVREVPSELFPMGIRRPQPLRKLRQAQVSRERISMKTQNK